MSSEAPIAPAWRPGLDAGTLAARGRMLAEVRAFFAARGVLEVDVPVHARTTVTDPAIESVRTADGWLQTSPEYFMKRLLAAGAGPIYQLGRAFRAGEVGRLHNPEFLLLEWYRPGFDDAALMAEMDALFAALLPGFPAARVPFARLVEDAFGVDPLTVDATALAAAIGARWAASGRDGDPLALCTSDGVVEATAVLDLAYAEALAASRGAVFVTDFPPSQASLARLREDAQGRTVAARFELIVEGVELANGFHELQDGGEQRRRFEADRRRRAGHGQAVPELDEHLLAALGAGLPDCAGVAVGMDRVLMLQLGRDRLDAVMPFAWSRC